MTRSDGLERITALPALLAATHKAALGKRQRPEVARFLMDAERHCLELGRRLRLPPDAADAWCPAAGHLHLVLDPKPRLITIVPFADRIVQHALCAEIVPALERAAIGDSWACRVGKGQHGAVRRAQRFARRWPWVLKVDIASFFASIPHEGLVAMLRRRVRDPGLRELAERIVLRGDAGIGLPIGALTSQHLANAYLGALDHVVKDDWGVRGYLRYMDDFLIFGERTELVERRALLDVTVSNLGLRLNLRVTCLMPVRDGVPFLGWRVFPEHVVARRSTWRRWVRRLGVFARAGRVREVGEDTAAASMAAATAHLATFDTFRLRRAALASRQEEGAGPNHDTLRLQPGEPRRLLEQRTGERSGRQSEQEHPGQPQEQPWGASRERNTSLRSSGLSDVAGSWPGGPYSGVDPARVLRAGAPAGPRAESNPPGGGPVLRGGVVAGLPFPSEPSLTPPK